MIVYAISRLIFVINTPDFVFTPEIQLINEDVVGDEYYSIIKENLTETEYESTLLGHRKSEATPSNWNMTEFKYYQDLFSEKIMINNETHYQSVNIYAARGPKNYNAEPSFFYFIMDPDSIDPAFKSILITKLNEKQLNGPCAHLKDKDKKYHIKVQTEFVLYMTSVSVIGMLLGETKQRETNKSERDR